jgi:hypothetical protein
MIIKIKCEKLRFHTNHILFLHSNQALNEIFKFESFEELEKLLTGNTLSIFKLKTVLNIKPDINYKLINRNEILKI